MVQAVIKEVAKLGLRVQVVAVHGFEAWPVWPGN